MILYTFLSENQLYEIAKTLNIKLHINEFKEMTKGKNKYYHRVNFRLYPIDNTFRLKSLYTGNKVYAVCLHGYTMFMISILHNDINAKFKSHRISYLITRHNIHFAYDDILSNSKFDCFDSHLINSEINDKLKEIQKIDLKM